MDHEYRITIYQPEYPEAGTADSARKTMMWCLDLISQTQPGSTDLIVLPEYINTAGIDDVSTADQIEAESSAYLEETIACEASRIGATVSCTMYKRDESGKHNRTVIFTPSGDRFVYDKTHLTDVESDEWGMIAGTRCEVFEIDGIRIGVAVCFEMYFPEFFEALASMKPDIILVPSYQRSEDGWRIDTMSSCRALDTGAYVVRSSYARPGTGKGGHSLVASPDASIMVNLEDEPGVTTITIDPKFGYRKPACHGGPSVSHRELIELHRRPETYRSEFVRERGPG